MKISKIIFPLIAILGMPALLAQPLSAAEITPFYTQNQSPLVQIFGLPAAGSAIVSHPKVKAISFTGSNAVGLSIQRTALERGAKAQLEMGGKNPALVMPSADLDAAEVAPEYSDGVFFVPLGSISDPEMVAPAIVVHHLSCFGSAWRSFSVRRCSPPE